MGASEPIHLEARGVSVQFDGLKAIDQVNFSMSDDEIVGLIGPNGAGKTTLLNVLSGFQPPTTGKVLLGGTDFTGSSPNRLARRGVARTFQSVRLFPTMTVRENVELGSIGIGSSRGEARKLADRILAALGLSHRADVLAQSLSHGEERLAGIARGVAVGPRFLLLDEPGAGLDEEESDELLEALRQLHRDFDLAILVVEHDMRLIMRLCARLHVLDYGGTLATGTPEEIRRHPDVLRAYLGAGGEHAAA